MPRPGEGCLAALAWPGFICALGLPDISWVDWWFGAAGRSVLLSSIYRMWWRMMLSRIRWTSDHIQLMCTMIQRDVEILVHRQSSQCFDANASLVPQQQEPGWHWWHSLRFVASYNTNRCRVLEVKIVSVSPVLAFCPSLSGKVQAGHCSSSHPGSAYRVKRGSLR